MIFQIASSDFLPHNICKNCSESLNVSYNFKILCDQSEIKLQKICDVVKQDEQETNYFEDDPVIDQVIQVKKVKKSSTGFKRLQKKKNRYSQYICETCGKNYHDRTSLAIHIRFHTGERPFICSVNDCNKGFAAEVNLKAHLRSHSGEKPYVCENCGKGCSTTGLFSFCLNNFKIWQKKKQTLIFLASLQTHKRTHTGEKPFECNSCNKTFANKSNLRTHTKIHSGDKRHVCAICGKAFSTSSDLNTHNRSHTGWKQILNIFLFTNQ